MTAYVADHNGNWVPQEQYSWDADHYQQVGFANSPAQNDLGARLIERAIESCQRGIEVNAYADKPGVYTVTFDSMRADIEAVQTALANSLHSNHIEIEVHHNDGFMTIVAY